MSALKQFIRQIRPLFLPFLLGTVTSACVSIDPENVPLVAVDPKTYPASRPCDSPAIAIQRVSRGFRYGCFCGGGYPGLKHPSGKEEERLNAEERMQLATMYFAITPVDDVDAACQAHDVCWILNPDRSVECNQVLQDKMKALQDKFVPNLWNTPVKSLRARCGELAADIRAATVLVMEGSSTDPATSFARGASTPIRGIGAAVVGALTITQSMLGDNYPGPGEVCRVLVLP